MTDNALAGLTLATALGCGLVGGVFFAFSTFVMRALGRLPAPVGMAAMQAINVTVLTPLFMLALFGTGLACVALAIHAVLVPDSPGVSYRLAGSVLYFGGTIVVTVAGNVPRNNALAAAGPGSAEGARVWADFLVIWTRWNHVRTAAALAAAVCLMLALQE